MAGKDPDDIEFERVMLRFCFRLERSTRCVGTPFLGGPGWNRTNDVSYVTVLQTAAIADYAY